MIIIFKDDNMFIIKFETFSKISAIGPVLLN